jgi:hypothetical protein
MRPLYLLPVSSTEKNLSIMFSLFFVASWGIVILVLVRKEWIYQPSEPYRPKWVFILPIILLFLLFGVLVFVGVNFATAPISTIWADFYRNIQSDTLFFVSFLGLLVGTTMLTIMAAVLQWQHRNEIVT